LQDHADSDILKYYRKGDKQDIFFSKKRNDVLTPVTPRRGIFFKKQTNKHE